MRFLKYLMPIVLVLLAVSTVLVLAQSNSGNYEYYALFKIVGNSFNVTSFT